MSIVMQAMNPAQTLRPHTHILLILPYNITYNIAEFRHNWRPRTGNSDRARATLQYIAPAIAPD